jgi:hypothetical protein
MKIYYNGICFILNSIHNSILTSVQSSLTSHRNSPKHESENGASPNPINTLNATSFWEQIKKLKCLSIARSEYIPGRCA